MNNPLVSVVIPTYNYAQFVCEAIDSVLAQTYDPVEVIVVDDGSKDDTSARLAAYGDQIRYIHQDNKGLPAARNTGIKAATGDYIAFLDADDLWRPNKLERQLGAFRAGSERVGLVHCRIEQLVDGKAAPKAHGPPLTTNDLDAQLESLLIKNTINGSASAVLMKRECFDHVGLFDETLRSAEDWDMWLRVAPHFEIVMAPDTLVVIRVHGANMSKNLDRMFEYQRRVLDKNFPKHISGWRRSMLRAKSYSAMLYGNGSEYSGADDRAERGYIIRSLRTYPAPWFMPLRYVALFRTMIGTERYKRLRGRLRSSGAS